MSGVDASMRWVAKQGSARWLASLKVASVINRLEVAQPVPRDSVRREPVVPESVARRKAEAAVVEAAVATESDPDGQVMGGPSNTRRGRLGGGAALPYADPHAFSGVFNYKGKD